MDLKLWDRTALVTGSSDGIGGAVAKIQPRRGIAEVRSRRRTMEALVFVVALVLLAAIRGGRQVPSQFSSLGQLAATGRRTGVANVLGIHFSGFAAWWLWRTVYLTKLPRLEKKLRVALDWTLDLVFSKDLVQFLTVRAPTLSRADEELDRTAGPQREAPMLAQEGPADSLPFRQ